MDARAHMDGELTLIAREPRRDLPRPQQTARRWRIDVVALARRWAVDVHGDDVVWPRLQGYPYAETR